jgi:hypothetical protein
MSVLQNPPEVTQHALIYLHLLNIASFSQTCRLAHTLVYNPGDQYIWHEVFLTAWDNPREYVNYWNANSSYDWKHELQRRIWAELITFNIEQWFNKTNFALEVFVSIISNASPLWPSMETNSLAPSDG